MANHRRVIKSMIAPSGNITNHARVQNYTLDSLSEDSLLPTTPSRKQGLLTRQRKLGSGRRSLISGGRTNGVSGVLG